MDLDSKDQFGLSQRMIVRVPSSAGRLSPRPGAAKRRRAPGESPLPDPGMASATPASGNRRRDSRRDLLQTDASASLRDPASPRPGGRRPDGSAVSRRLPRCGAAAARAGSKSSLKRPSERSAVGARVVRPARIERTRTSERLASARRDGPQFPLRPYSCAASAAAGEPSRAAAAGGGEAPMADTWSVPPTHSTFFGAKLTLGPASPSLTASTAPRPYSRGAAIASLLLLIGAACAWRIPEVQPAAASR
jgi:hypothetical protein